MHFGAGFARVFDAGAELDGFYGLDRHEGLGDAAVEFFVPGSVRAEADNDVFCDYFEDAAKRVAIFLCLIDQGHHLLFGGAVGTIERGIGWNSCDFFPFPENRRNRNAAELDNVTFNFHTEGFEKLFGQGSAGDSRSRFAGGGSFQDIAKVAGLEFLSAGKVCMSGARAFNEPWVFGLRLKLGVGHYLLPVYKVPVLDL